MSIRLTHMMNNSVVIARKSTTSGDKLAFTTVTTEAMHIQPAGRSSDQIREGVFGKEFTVYTDAGADISAGDRLRDDDDNYYTVTSDGVTRRSVGSIEYKVVTVQKTT